MGTDGFTVFETAIGHCGIGWRGAGHGGVVTGTSLPEDGEERTRARLRTTFPDAAEQPPPAFVREAIGAITALLAGEPADLSGIPLDLSGVPLFHARVYEVVRAVPPGGTLTYGEIARHLEMPGSARAVGQAMGHNPFPPIVPCHRVLAAGGKPGGFSARGGQATKRRMLAIEGVYLEEPALFDL